MRTIGRSSREHAFVRRILNKLERDALMKGHRFALALSGGTCSGRGMSAQGHPGSALLPPLRGQAVHGGGGHRRILICPECRCRRRFPSEGRPGMDRDSAGGVRITEDAVQHRYCLLDRPIPFHGGRRKVDGLIYSGSSVSFCQSLRPCLYLLLFL